MSDARAQISCCPDCGHPDYFHRENGRSQSSTFDDPTPCFAAQVAETIEVAGKATTFRYSYCGCTTVRPLVLQEALL